MPASSCMMRSRGETADGFGKKKTATMACFTSSAAPKDLTARASWKELTAKNSSKALVREAQSCPMLPEEENEAQKHLSLFVHGYHNDWADSVKRYASIQSSLYDGPNSQAVLVLYIWLSEGNVAGYLPDREDARACAPDLADALVAPHDQIIVMQRAATMTDKSDAKRFCKAKISVIAHSMGNFVVQKALAAASQRLNKPQLVTLVHQLAMVAADVDIDLFQKSQPADGKRLRCGRPTSAAYSHA